MRGLVIALLLGAASAFAPSGARQARLSPMRMALYGEPRPVQIIPSVLPADFGALGKDVKALEDAGVDRIQFDVMDGNFVPYVAMHSVNAHVACCA